MDNSENENISFLIFNIDKIKYERRLLSKEVRWFLYNLDLRKRLWLRQLFELIFQLIPIDYALRCSMNQILTAKRTYSNRIKRNQHPQEQHTILSKSAFASLKSPCFKNKFPRCNRA